MARPLWTLSIVEAEREPRLARWLSDAAGFVCGLGVGAAAILWLLWAFA